MGLFAESRKVISKKGLFSQSRITTPSTTTPVYWNKEKDEPVNPPVAKPTSKIVMPLRPNSVRTEPASSVPKRIGGPQHEPAYAPAPSTYIPKAPVLSTQGGGIGIKPSPQLSVVAQKYGGDPIKQTTAGLARGIQSLIPSISYGGAVVSEAANNLINRPQGAQQARNEQAFQQRQLTYARENTNKKFGITPRDEQSLAYGLGQSIPAMSTLAVPGVGAALFATSAGGNAANRANQIAPDAPAWKKALYGTAVGLAELGTEKIFFFAPGAKTFIAKKLGMTAAKVITTAIRPVGEATQEAIMDPIASLMEKVLFDPDRAWVGNGGVVDLKQMNSDAQAGAIMGLVFMGMGSSNASVKGMSEQAYANSQKTGVPVTAAEVQPILDAITLDAKKNPTAYTPNKSKFTPQPIQTQPIQQNAPQPVTGALNANVEQPELNLQRFGLTEPGPMTGTGKVVESKLSENIAKGRIGNDAITEAYKKDPVTHKQLTHTQTLEVMNNKMSSYDGTPNSLDAIFDGWADRVDGKSYDAADVALTRVLANEFTTQGRQFKADQAYAMLIEKQTEMGRLIDATKLLYDASTPTAVKTVLDRFLRTVNKEGLAKYGDKWNDMSLKPEEIQRITDLSENGTLSNENIDIIKEEVATRMSLEMPRTAGEVLNSWRRFAMLTSPKTHIRNLVSNAVRAVMEGQKNVTATFLEKALNVPKQERLRAMGWKSDGLQKNQSRVDVVENAWTQNKKEMSSKMKYEISSLASLEVRKDAFKPGPVKTASNFVMNALQVEDVWFMKPAFDSALGQMMKARNVDVPTVEMIDRAKNVAWDVTFKKMNGLSNAILKWKRTGGIVGGIGEAVLPFVTTPAAIAKTTVEFTPIGFVKTLLDARNNLTITKADKVDALSKSITGTSYIVAGILAGMSGILFGADEKSKKAKEIQELGGGRQKYSIAIPEFMGGGTYTMDWMQPTGTLFFIGAQMGADIAKGKTDYTIDGAIDVVLSGADTFLNQSMLQGVKGIFQNPGSTAEGIAGIGADWINQFIPTIWSQVARGVDPAQRIGYGGGWLTSAGKAIQSKTIPQGIGPLKPLEPKIDVYGNPKPTGFGKTEVSQSISRLALSLLSPGFYRPETQDPVAKEVYRVYQSTKDTSALPTTIPTNIGSKQLTDAEKTQFATEYGKGAHSAVQTEISKSGYKSASDEDKVDRLRKAMQSVYDKQRKKMAK